MRVLVAAASRHGATAEIAGRIGARLGERGLSVEVKKVDDVDDVSGYDAFVLGSAVYFGKWLGEAIRFVEDHADEFAARPTWLFGSGSIVGDPPVGDDPKAMRASLIDKLTTSTRARELKLFGGKLDRSKLSGCEKLPRPNGARTQGDWRDVEQVDAWATAIADGLRRGEARATVGVNLN
jgi:menaquinone-dependent protoporphyrinogen oxidase